MIITLGPLLLFNHVHPKVAVFDVPLLVDPVVQVHVVTQTQHGRLKPIASHPSTFTPLE